MRGRIDEAQEILVALGLPRAQLNERSALCLLALVDLRPKRQWSEAADPLIGVTPMMDWIRTHYGKDYAPNTRETIRRQTMHQFVAAGIALYNPDDPGRPVNSPKAVYQVEPKTLDLLRRFGSRTWAKALQDHAQSRPSLTESYAKRRKLNQIPVQLANGATIELTPGAHSQLIKDIVAEFAPRFAPGSVLVYAGDTGKKWGYFDEPRLTVLGVSVDAHGKMPDVVLHDTARGWLLLVEAVTSHGPVDGKRHAELSALFATAKAGLVYVTAFPSRSVMAKYLAEIAWETEVWTADAPDHLIHFNGERFLGPYKSSES